MIQRKRKTVRVSVDSLRRERDLAPLRQRPVSF